MPHSQIRSLETISEIAEFSVGILGGQYSGTATITPATNYVFNAIQVITDAVLTCTGNITGLTAITISEGTVIYGTFTSITIASGTVIAYQGNEQ